MTQSQDELLRTIRHVLGDADEDSVRIVGAIAGLLAAVAYADREFDQREAAQIKDELGRVNGIDRDGVRALSHLIEKRLLHAATVDVTRYARTLRELADRDLRLEILELLLRLAAADDSISHEEVVMLRNLTQSLGLSQDDYNRLQAPFRDKLESLRKSKTTV